MLLMIILGKTLSRGGGIGVYEVYRVDEVYEVDRA